MESSSDPYPIIAAFEKYRELVNTVCYREIEKVAQVFEKMREIIEKHGGHVIKMNIAPNGRIIFTLGDKLFYLDFLWGWWEV